MQNFNKILLLFLIRDELKRLSNA